MKEKRSEQQRVAKIESKRAPKHAKKAPKEKKASYEQVLKTVKSEFSKSRQYRSIASEK